MISYDLQLQELKHINRMQDQCKDGPFSAPIHKRDLLMTHVSLAVVFVFIVCHSIKWIPNIYEFLQVSYGWE